jgi:DNA-binding CsgD family transcriptional regulator
MLDTLQPGHGQGASLSETVQRIYDLLTNGGALGDCVELIRRELSADRAELSSLAREGRDSAAARLLASIGQSLPSPQSERLDIEASHREQPNRLRLSLWRYEGDPFSPADLGIAQDLLRHLHRARALTARLGLQATEAGIYSSVLDRLAVGAIFLDARGQILRRTGLAAELLTQRDGLREIRGAVAATSGADDRRLQGAIRAVLDPRGAEPVQPVTLVVSRTEGGFGLGLIVQPLAQGPGDPDDAVAVILIRDPDRGGTPEKAMLRVLFDLTPAEAELARNLTLGASLDEAAAALSISRNTARAHLRAIFSKSGITRQTEMMRLMLSSAAMLGQGIGTAA